MTRAEIQSAYIGGYSKWEILHMAVRAGREFPDAVFAVSQALRMDAEEVEEMETAYDENC